LVFIIARIDPARARGQAANDANLLCRVSQFLARATVRERKGGTLDSKAVAQHIEAGPHVSAELMQRPKNF
jgi:hypothetical protein